MNCLKCGRETPSEQVFCHDCLLEMEKHPVKPGTVVLLPRQRDTAAQKKAQKRRTIPLEEQVKVLKRRVRILTAAALLFAVLMLLFAFPAIEHLMEGRFKKGQNYKAVTTTTTEPLETIESGN